MGTGGEVPDVKTEDVKAEGVLTGEDAVGVLACFWNSLLLSCEQLPSAKHGVRSVGSRTSLLIASPVY